MLDFIIQYWVSENLMLYQSITIASPTYDFVENFGNVAKKSLI